MQKEEEKRESAEHRRRSLRHILAVIDGLKEELRKPSGWSNERKAA